MLLTAESRGTGFIRDQIGYLEKDEAKIRLVTQDTNSYKTLRLSADGKILSAMQVKISNSFYEFPASGAVSGNAPGAAASALPVTAVTQERDVYGFNWAPDAKLLVNDGGKLLRVSATGGDEAVLLSEANTVMALPASCANGKYIVFTWAGYHGSPFANIWRVDSDGTNPKQITNERDIARPGVFAGWQVGLFSRLVQPRDQARVDRRRQSRSGAGHEYSRRRSRYDGHFDFARWPVAGVFNSHGAGRE